MAVKHLFTSAKADGADATLVQPSDWNDNHTIENDTVTYAQMQNISAASKLLGRGDSGSGDAEEISLGSGLSMSGTTLSASGGGLGYALSHGCSNNFSPADATTYYFGGPVINPDTSSGYHRMYIPKAGTIKAAYLHAVISATPGSTESVSVYVRLNGSSDVTVTTTATWDTEFEVMSNTGLSQAVVAGDYITWKIVTPTWATNPTGVYLWGVVYIE